MLISTIFIKVIVHVKSAKNLKTRILINSILYDSHQKRGKNGSFVFILALLSSMFLLGENFSFDLASVKTLSFVHSFTWLVVGRIFHRLASTCVHFKPCFSTTTHILLGLEDTGHVHIMIWPYFCTSIPWEIPDQPAKWTVGTFLEVFLKLEVKAKN